MSKRNIDPTKLLLGRATAGQGIVLDAVAIQKVASDLVGESLRAESLQRVSAELRDEIEKWDGYCAALERMVSPSRGRKQRIDKLRNQFFGEQAIPYIEETQTTTPPTRGPKLNGPDQ